MGRNFENWLYGFKDWVLPRQREAPESLIIWSGLFALSSVVKDHVRFPKSIMGSYEIVPNLYILFVGPAGVIRKSTCAGYAETLLSEVESVVLSSTGTSDSQLIKTLHSTPDGTISILSSEFSEFMKTSEIGMYSFLTDVYDRKAKYEYSTRAHGIEKIVKPVINLLGATTPEWVSSQAPEHLTGAGFSSRVIFIYENTVRGRQLYYDISWPMFEKMRILLQQDLREIAKLDGDFKHDCVETKNFMEDWYRQHADLVVGDKRLQGYLSRRHVHVHKVAMLLALAESDELVVNRTHFQASIALFEAAERNMPRALSAVGRNPFGRDIEDTLEFIHLDCGGRWVNRREILGRFYYDVEKYQMIEILATLVQLGALEVKMNATTQPPEPLYRALKSRDDLAMSFRRGASSEPQAPGGTD